MRVLKRLVLVSLASSAVLLVLSVSVYKRVIIQVDKKENLIEQLQSFDWNQRRQAAEALSRMGDDHAVEPLVDALKDNDSDVRQKAAEALDKLGWQPKNEAERRLYFIAKKDWDKCVELDGAAVDALIMVLRDKNPETRKKAVEAVGRIQNPSIKPLVAALRDDNHKVRERAAEALGRIGDSRAVKPLVASLNDTSWEVRERVAGALIEIGGIDVMQQFIAALRDEHLYTREKAAEALGKIGDNRAVEPLVAALNDTSWEVREKAAEALSRMGDDHVLEPLVDALKDNDSDVRQKAAESLDKLGWQPKNEAEQRLYFIAKKDWDKCVELDGVTVDALIMVLRDKNPEVRKKTMETLIKLGGLRTVRTLIGALEHDDRNIRKGAAETLGKIGGKQAVKPLIAVLRNEYPDVREAAARALVNIGGLYAMGPLIDALKDDDSDVREAVAEILGKISNPALKPLITTLWDKNWEVREEAAKTLGKLGDSRAVNPLIAVLNEEGRVHQETEGDLYEIPNLMFRPSIAPFMNRKNRLYIEVIKALGQIGDKRAIPALVGELQSWDTAQAAADALDRFGWSPQSTKDKVHFLVAKRDGNTLRQIWEHTKSVLLKDIKSEEDKIVKNALFAFIAVGKQEIIKELIDTLNAKGDRTIAKVYRNCGNEKLSGAAQDWAVKHHDYISTDSGPYLVSWASWQLNLPLETTLMEAVGGVLVK